MTTLRFGWPALAAACSSLLALVACGGGGGTTGTTGSGGSTSSTTTTTASTTVTTGTGGGTSGTGGSTSGTGGATGTGGSTTTGTGGAGGGCGAGQTVDYNQCSGTSFFPDGTCLNGECATVDLETRVFKAWKAKIKAISGLDDATLADRVKVAKVSHSGGPDQVFVRIDYVVVLDWVRSRQADSPQLGNTPLVNPPTDQEIDSAVTLAVENAEWTGLAAIGQVAPESATQAGFDSCACGMKIDFCHIDFQNVTGKLLVKGGKTIDAAQNKCKEAKVRVDTGAQEACMDAPCAIN
ncbi:MAG: hypothetical protein U0359_23470 [Byssovorax sp.]